MIENLYIVNRSGGLIYSHDNSKETNGIMIFASTLHSLSEIARTCLESSSYCQFIQYDTKTLALYLTLSGLTFMFVGDENMKSKVESAFKRVYKYFSEFILSDPYYNLEMPIKNKRFEPEAYF